MDWLAEKIKDVFITYRVEFSLIVLSIATALVSFFMFYKLSGLNKYDDRAQFISADISGAVKKPGLYRFTQGTRVEDAIQMAGGYKLSADRSYVEQNMNRAQILTDQYKIYIPTKDDTERIILSDQSSTTLISINSSDINELEKLPDIGSITAEKIITSRPYEALDELLTKGVISKKLYEKIKTQISL